MTLSFPNSSRSFDETRKGVRFVGHDGMFEVKFMIDADALSRSSATDGADLVTEAQYLDAFDAGRRSIHTAAVRAYASGRGSTCILTAADLR